MAVDGLRPLALWGLVSSNQFNENNIDFYESVCPLYEPFIQQCRGSLFDIEKLRAYSANELMLPLPDDVAQILCDRMGSLGWLKAEGSVNGATVYRCIYASSEKNVVLSNVDKNLNIVISTFRRFVSDNSIKFEYDDNYIEESFLRFFTRNLNSVSIENEDVSSVEQIEYWIARFVSWAASQNVQVFGVMQQLSGTCLLAEAVMEMRAPSLNRSARIDLTVFLDGPLAMELLGLSGTKNRENIDFVAKKLREQGANIACFRHNCDEIAENLHALLERPHLDRTGPTADALRRGELQEKYVISVKNNVEYFIKEAGIIVIPSTPAQYKSVERFCDQNTLIRLAAKLPGNRDVSRQRDADSITIVMRRRQGHETNSLMSVFRRAKLTPLAG